MQKSLTVQELEKLDTESYRENPDQLLSFARQLLNIKKYEKAIEILEKAIRYAISNNDNDESNINCAKFYCEYADALIRKQIDNEELFANPLEGEMNEEKQVAELKNGSSSTPAHEKENKDNNIEAPNSNNNSKFQTYNIVHSNNNIQQEETANEDEGEEDQDAEDEDDSSENNNQSKTRQPEESDEQIAFENLAFAEKVYKNYLRNFDKEDPTKVDNEIKQKYFELSEVYQKFGELDMCRSDFKGAVSWYEKALEVRKPYDDKFSRAIAEIYFNMATVYDFDATKSLLCYYKTKTILEHHLKEALNKHGLVTLADKIQIKESDLEFEGVLKQQDIKLHKEVIESKFDEGTPDEITELVDILNQVYQKVKIICLNIL